MTSALSDCNANTDLASCLKRVPLLMSSPLSLVNNKQLSCNLLCCHYKYGEVRGAGPIKGLANYPALVDLSYTDLTGQFVWIRQESLRLNSASICEDLCLESTNAKFVKRDKWKIKYLGTCKNLKLYELVDVGWRQSINHNGVELMLSPSGLRILLSLLAAGTIWPASWGSISILFT